MRMQMRRFTRLTNAFSKKFREPRSHGGALYRLVQFQMLKAIKMTPALPSGISDRRWSMEDVANLVEATAPKPGKRGPYKRRDTENSN